ncbi:hypothetical protein DM02DRAFT_697456 [Periconia macrospinosa]|uniref:Uncharacterized protein n=1 Tax=Periconia macrospinosa TaxID=97972 RepID=A0A2V1D524_9PLEO|nr:hypothetical protein DM02DRAFT_697456 [Periconia macrospinosa]
MEPTTGTDFPSPTEAEPNRPLEQAKHHTPPQEWKAWALRKPWTITVLVFNVALIVAVLALERLSAQRNGLVEVHETSNQSASLSIHRITSSTGLLWTSLPSFIMVLNRLAWNSIVSAASERQPYVDIRKEAPKGACPSRSIMLDYRSYASLIAWVFACRNSHWLLGICMGLNQILSIFIIPIAAYILTPTTISLSTETTIDLARAFNGSLLDSTTDAQRAINEASAVLIYGATPPPYITSEYAFEPFSNVSVTTGNVTAAIDAFSAGGYPNNDVDAWNLTVVSCVPSFWRTHGNLTVALQSTAPSRFNFLPGQANSSELDLFKYQIPSLPSYQVFDPTAKFHTDAFGRAVFEYSAKLNPDSPFDSSTLMESMEKTFSAMMAFITGTALFEPVERRKVAAVQSINKMKILVVTPVAYTLIAVMTLVVLCNLWIIWYMDRYPSCLHEEPRGLLRMADLIHRSNLSSVVSRIRDEYPGGGGIEEIMQREYAKKEWRISYDIEKQRILVVGKEGNEI